MWPALLVVVPELATIICITVIAIVSIAVLNKDAVPVVSSLGGGLVGYLAKGLVDKLKEVKGTMSQGSS